MGSPAVTPPSVKSKGKATKEMISVIAVARLPPQVTRVSEPPQARSTSISRKRHLYRDGNGPRSTRLLDDDIGRKPILGKPVDGKRANDGYRCELCGAWIEIPRPWQSAAHEDPLPHRSNDRKQQNPPQGAI